MKITRVQLGDIIESANPGFASGENVATGVVQLRMNNVVTDGSLDWTSLRRVPAEGEKLKKYSLRPGDIVFNSTNSPELVGKTALFAGFKEPVLFSNHFLRVRVNRDAAEPGFVARWINFRWQQRQFEGLCTRWVNQASVRKEDLLDLCVELPPLPEQRRIAGVLDQADRLRRTRRYALELSDNFLKAVFLEMFSDPSKRFDTVELEEIARDVPHALSSGPFGSNLTSVDYVTEGVPILRGLNVTGGRLDLDDLVYVTEAKATELTRSEVRPGDIVIVAVGASGLACQVTQCLPRAIMSQNFNKVTPCPKKVEASFVEFCINSQIVQRQLKQEITDTVRTFLSLTKLKKVKIPLPPIALQRTFSEIVQRSERLRAVQREALRQAEHLFQSLLHRAFTTGL